MKRILFLGAIVLLAASGCEQRAQNQGNFAKTEEFFKEMETPGTQANADLQAVVPPAQNMIQASADVASALPEAPTQEIALPINPTITDIQQALQNADLYQGKIDGVMGPRTKQAIQKFQTQNNLKVDGKVGPKTWAELKGFLARSLEPMIPSDTTNLAAQETTAND